MKVVFADTDERLVTTSGIYEVASVENGITSIELEGLQETVKVPNSICFTLTNGDEIYLIASVSIGEDIIKRLFQEDKIDLSEYKDNVIFYPYNEDDKKDISNCLNLVSFL